MTREEKQKAIDAVERLNALKQFISYDKDSEIVQTTQKSIDMAIKALEQEPKILDTLDFAIDASNGDTNYFVGFRNGLRYSKSLIDGKEPQFESCAEQEPKTGHWIYICNNVVNGLKVVKCSECGKRTYGSNRYCPNCGVKMFPTDLDCNSCKYQKEVDGSNCYECVKGMRNNYTAESEDKE